jgi:cytoskeletal protein RodZ
MISEQGPARPLHADDTPTEVFQAIRSQEPNPPLRTQQMGLPPRKKERRQVRLSAMLAVVILAVLGVAGYKVASGVGGKSRVAAITVSTSAASAQSRAGSVPSSASAQASAPASASPSVSPSSASPSPSQITVAARTLKPSGVTAVGPGGAAGDDEAAADYVLDGSTSTAWQTDWYATPEFGGLQTGTGLLINMGQSVTITSVQVTLGSEAGLDFQIRVGDSSSVSKLTTVATEAGAGGTVRLTLTPPAQARYVLIWFTKLASDGAGTYQAKVYNVSVTGQP